MHEAALAVHDIAVGKRDMRRSAGQNTLTVQFLGRITGLWRKFYRDSVVRGVIRAGSCAALGSRLFLACLISAAQEQPAKNNHDQQTNQKDFNLIAPPGRRRNDGFILQQFILT